MIKRKKRLCILMAVAMLTTFFAFPAPALASSGSVAAVTYLKMSASTVASGQTVSVDIRTTSAANTVVAVVDGKTVAATNSGTDTAGSKIWALSIKPTQTQVVKLYVSVTADVSNATVLELPVTVSGSGSSVTTPVATPPPTSSAGESGVTISSVTEAWSGKTVTLTVRTNTLANNVWVNYDGKYTQATLSNSDTNGKNWTLKFNPSIIQVVTVSANTSYKTNGATNISHQLVEPPAPPAKPTISNVSANRTNLYYNENTTITVRTNVDTEYVWVDYDNTTEEADLQDETRTYRSWKVTIRPSKTQTVKVYANTVDGSTGAVSRNLSLSVGNQYSNRATVSSAYANWNTYATYSDGWLKVDATTNSYAAYVWFVYNGQEYNMQRSSGSNTWYFDGYVNNNNYSYNNSLVVYASEQRNDNYPATRSVSIGNNYNGGSGSVNLYKDSGYLSSNYNDRFTLRIETDINVTDVTVSNTNYNFYLGNTSNTSTSYAAGGNISGSRRLWYIDIYEPSYGASSGSYSFLVRTRYNNSSWYEQNFYPYILVAAAARPVRFQPFPRPPLFQPLQPTVIMSPSIIPTTKALR